MEEIVYYGVLESELRVDLLRKRRFILKLNVFHMESEGKY